MVVSPRRANREIELSTSMICIEKVQDCNGIPATSMVQNNLQIVTVILVSLFANFDYSVLHFTRDFAKVPSLQGHVPCIPNELHMCSKYTAVKP